MCFSRNVWSSKEDLIRDINNNEIYVEINTQKITRFQDTKKDYFVNNNKFDNCFCEKMDPILRCAYKDSIYEDTCMDFCETLNICNEKTIRDFCCTKEIENKPCLFCCCIPCNICFCSTVCAISTITHSVLCCYDCTSNICNKCIDCNKRCDLRGYTINNTQPFDFRGNMVYEDTTCPYCIAPKKLSFSTEFKTNFGKVKLEYNKNYTAGLDPEKYGYVSKLYIDDIEQNIVPIKNRGIVPSVGNDCANIVRQYME